MTNAEWLREAPLPVVAQWLCDINKCDTCWFKNKKNEALNGSCTWQWLHQDWNTGEENERPEQD